MMRRATLSRWIVFDGSRYLRGARWTTDVAKAERFLAETALIKSVFHRAVALAAPAGRAR